MHLHFKYVFYKYWPAICLDCTAILIKRESTDIMCEQNVVSVKCHLKQRIKLTLHKIWKVFCAICTISAYFYWTWPSFNKTETCTIVLQLFVFHIQLLPAKYLLTVTVTYCSNAILCIDMYENCSLALYSSDSFHNRIIKNHSLKMWAYKVKQKPEQCNLHQHK